MKYFTWVFLFFLIVYLLPLGNRPLVTPEYSFAETAREMVVSGNYVTPQLLGEAAENTPAPAYYPAAKSIQLFGANGFAVRFPGALAAGLSALFIWILISQTLRDEKLAALSSIIYLTFSGVYFSGTVAAAGIIFAMLVIGSCGSIFTAVQENKFNRRKIFYLLLGGVFMGLGFVVNGFEAVIIPLISGIFYLLWDRKWKQLPLLLIVPPFIAAAIALPWVMIISRTEPEYLIRITREAIASFYTEDAGVSRYLYLRLFALGAFPGILLIPAAGVVGKDAWSGFLRQPLFRFAFCFMFTPLILLAASPKWNVSAMLCSFAPLALLIAAGVRTYFNSGCHHRSYNWIMTTWGFALAIAGAVLLTLHFTKPAIIAELPLTGLFYPVMGSVLLFAGAMMIYSIIGNWRGRLYLYFFSIGLVLLFMPWFFKSNPMMPGEALRQLKENHPELKSAEYTIVANTPEVADAAAWEFQRSDIRSADKVFSGKTPVTTPKMFLILNDHKDCKCEFIQNNSFKLSGKTISVNPLEMMIFDIVKNTGK